MSPGDKAQVRERYNIPNTGPSEDLKLSLSRSELNFPAKASASTFIISNSGGGTLKRKVFSDKDWISLSSHSGTGKKKITASASNNKYPNTFELSPDKRRNLRKGNIIVSSNGVSKKINVMQWPERFLFTIETKEDTVFSTSLNYNVSNSDVLFAIPPEPELTPVIKIIYKGKNSIPWNISTEADWISFSPQSGTNDGNIKIKVNDNLRNKERSARFTLNLPDHSAGNTSFSRIIYQKPSERK